MWCSETCGETYPELKIPIQRDGTSEVTGEAHLITVQIQQETV